MYLGTYTHIYLGWIIPFGGAGNPSCGICIIAFLRIHTMRLTEPLRHLFVPVRAGNLPIQLANYQSLLFPLRRFHSERK